MPKKYCFVCLFLICSMLPLQALRATRASVFRTEEDSKMYLNEHYNAAAALYNEAKWRQAANEFEKVAYYFPNEEEASNAYYFLGVCCFHLQEYDFANQAFSNYLKSTGHSLYFEEAVQYKFCIAEYFKSGQKRRLFKMRYCPKWASARTMALHTYDEIIFSVPNHDLAARALYSKGHLLQSMGEYRESVDAYQMLARRFPKHELMPQSYLQISQAYCQQSRYEFQNPDLLALAELNARKFRMDFARDERIEIADGYVARIKENFAKGLCETGTFYERMEKPTAAVIYYQSAIEEFPDTLVADFCRERLVYLGCPYTEDNEAACTESSMQSEANNSSAL